MKKLEYIAFEDIQVQGDWRVEFVAENGEQYITIFSGDDCERRAVEYAAFKNGKLPTQRPPAPVTFGAPSDIFEITTNKGEKINIRPKDLIWQYNAHLRRITGNTRPPIDVVSGPKGKK